MSRMDRNWFCSRALNPRLASALTEGCSVTVFLLLVLLQKASRGSQHLSKPQMRPHPHHGVPLFQPKCNKIRDTCVKLQTEWTHFSMAVACLHLCLKSFPSAFYSRAWLNRPVWLHSVL